MIWEVGIRNITLLASGFLTIPALKKQCRQREKSIKKYYTVSWCKLTEFTKNWTLLIVKITKQMNISVSYFYHNYNLLYWSASSITRDNWSSFQRGFVLLLVWRYKSSLLLRGLKFHNNQRFQVFRVLSVRFAIHHVAYPIFLLEKLNKFSNFSMVIFNWN